MESARNVVLVGPMGAGKSTVARELASLLGWPWVDLDQVIEAEARATIPALFAREGETGFRDREQACLAAVLAGRQPVVLALGGGTVLRAGNRDLLKTRTTAVWLHAPLATCLERAAPARRPLLAAASGAAAAQLFRERRDRYAAVSELVVGCVAKTPAAIAQRIREELPMRPSPLPG